MGPLAGVRVVEMAGLGPVPLCGMMLSDYGAEVFLIERKGDASAESTLHVSKRDMMRRGKVALPLDMKSEDDKQTLLKLIETADVLIEGFRPGVMERLGLGPDICLQRQPALIYARLTGWGQTGPLAQTAGHDPNYIALTGTLYHSGDADSPPQAPATLLGDSAGGAAMMAFGISAALLPAKQRGVGQVIDASIVEGTAYLASFARSFYLAGQMDDQRGSGWLDGGAPWNRSYRCADGQFMTVCPVEARFYWEMLGILGLQSHDLFADGKQWNTADWPAQIEHLTTVFASQSRDDWSTQFEGSDACAAPVLSYAEVPLHPHNQARESYVQVDSQWHAAPAPVFSKTGCEPDWHDERKESAEAALKRLGIE